MVATCYYHHHGCLQDCYKERLRTAMMESMGIDDEWEIDSGLPEYQRQRRRHKRPGTKDVRVTRSSSA
jgi:hypothetical protein